MCKIKLSGEVRHQKLLNQAVASIPLMPRQRIKNWIPKIQSANFETPTAILQALELKPIYRCVKPVQDIIYGHVRFRMTLDLPHTLSSTNVCLVDFAHPLTLGKEATCDSKTYWHYTFRIDNRLHTARILHRYIYDIWNMRAGIRAAYHLLNVANWNNVFVASGVGAFNAIRGLKRVRVYTHVRSSVFIEACC